MKKLALMLGTLVLLLAATGPMPAGAAIAIVVNSLSDPGDGDCEQPPAGNCTLREAINLANSDSGVSAINITVTGAIKLTSALPDLIYPVGIYSPTAEVTINGQGALRIFNIVTTWDADIEVTLAGLTLTYGYGGHGAAIDNEGTLHLIRCTLTWNEASGNGGAIYNNGTLTIENSTLYSNSATTGGAIFNNGTLTILQSSITWNGTSSSGAGIYHQGTLLTIDESTIADNLAYGDGGGIYNESPLTVTNSTFFDNSAYDHGGAVSQGSAHPVEFTNSTFVSNYAPEGGVFYTRTGWNITCTNCTIYSNHADIYEAALDAEHGGIYLRNSIVGNTTLGGQNCLWFHTGFNLGNNLEDDDTCAFYSNDGSHQNVTTLKMGILGDYGGLTQTVPIAWNSAAVNAVTYEASDCGTGLLARDQRGKVRPMGGTGGGQCDSGAFELPVLINMPLVIK